MTSDFVLTQLDVIAGSASEKESGNETAERMLSFFRFHKEGNEAAISKALQEWSITGEPFRKWIAEYLMKELKLT